MKEQESPTTPRYVERTEEVVYGLGGYFHLRLGSIRVQRQNLLALRAKKQAAIDSLPKGWFFRKIRLINYGDWLTDYETEEIESLSRTEERLNGVMEDVIRVGRVDRAERELLEIITASFGYLKLRNREFDAVGRQIVWSTFEVAEEAIDALAIIDREAAEEYRNFLEGLRESEDRYVGSWV